MLAAALRPPPMRLTPHRKGAVSCPGGPIKGLYVGYPLKHFPLRIHPHPPVVAAAAEGAGDQGKFRAMHHRLFEQMEQWSTGDDPDTALVRLARLQLDRAQFSACLMGRRTLEPVLRDLYDGQGIGVRSMPTFILFYGGTGHVLTGAHSAEQFAATLQHQLESAKSGGDVRRRERVRDGRVAGGGRFVRCPVPSRWRASCA